MPAELTPVREIQSIPTLIVRTLANSLPDVNLVLEATYVSRHLKDTILMAMSILSNDIAATTALRVFNYFEPLHYFEPL